MATVTIKCPKCGSERVVKNGTMERWRNFEKYRVQMMRCRDCGKQFTSWVIHAERSRSIYPSRS